QIRLKQRRVVCFLSIMQAELRDWPADHFESGACGSEPKPQLVVHAVVRRFINRATGPIPDLSREEDLRLKKELSCVPATIQIEEIVERQYAFITTRKMSFHQLAIAPQLADAGNHVGTTPIERQGDAGESVRREAVVTIEPGENLAPGDSHPFVDGVT